jgi:hypothetical protein
MKKAIALPVLIVLLVFLVGCEISIPPSGLPYGNEVPSSESNPDENLDVPTQSNPPLESSSVSGPAQDVSFERWEKVDSQIIVPNDEAIVDGNESIKYKYSSSSNSISLMTESDWPEGNEQIETYGGWTIPEDTYFVGQTIRIVLTGGINRFEWGRTNFSGVSGWAYLGSENTPLGSTTEQVLRDNKGEGTCKATIDNGKIAVGQSTKEVSIPVPKGSENEKMVIIVVVSNQGKQSGVKYFYEWKDD